MSTYTIKSNSELPDWRWDDHLLSSSILQQGKNECWIWTGQKQPDGRAYFRAFTNSARLSQINPQRLIYAKKHHTVLRSNEQIFTVCGNKNCMNPNHLFVGSKEDLRNKEHGFNLTKFPWQWLRLES